MARYKVPTSINRSMLDHEIVLTGGGMQAKPMPLRIILYWIGILFAVLILISRTPLSGAGIFPIVLFLIWVTVVAAFFGQYSKTKEMKFQSLPALINYSIKGNRRILTRNNSNPYGFMTLTGVRSIDSDGLITFLDGNVGQFYSVVGTGSRLLFDGDKEAIINRVRAFWEKVDTSCEWTFITTREPQQIVEQIAHAERLNYDLTVPGLRGKRVYPDIDRTGHSDLKDLLNERYALLQYVAGVNMDGSKGQKFMSIHQYLLIRASSLEDLQVAHSVLEAEVNSSSAMFKECRMIDTAKKTVDILRTIYQGREKTEVRAAPKKGSLEYAARERHRQEIIAKEAVA